MLAIGPKRFPAGDEQMDVRRFPKNLFGQRRGRIYGGLAAIQDQQHPPPFQEGDDAGSSTTRLHGDAQGGRQPAGEQLGFENTSDIEEADIAVELGGQVVTQSKRHAGFADAARPCNGHEPVFEKLFAERSENFIAAHKPVRPGGQRSRRRRPDLHGPLAGNARYRRNERVALTGDIGDVAAFAQRLAKRIDVKPEAAFLDDTVGPHLPQQLGFPNHLSGMLKQTGEDIEGPASKRNGLAVPLDQPAGTVHPERPK